MPDGRWRRWSRLQRRVPLLVAAVAAAVVASVLVTVAVPATTPKAVALGTGSTLLTETFQGGSVSDPNWVALGDACLTGASASPPQGESNLGPCRVFPGRTYPTPQHQSPPYGQQPGYLQLTDASYFADGAVLYDQALPSSGGIDVTFDQYQYGGATNNFSGPRGADGIGFFLINGADELTSPGTNGGSLGYAQNSTEDCPSCTKTSPGVHDGIVGVGLDVFGNYGNDSEGRGNGCADRRPGAGTNGIYSTTPLTAAFPNAISVRGVGDGLLGYCWLAGTTTYNPPDPGGSTLPGSLDGGPITDFPTVDGGYNPSSAMRTVRVQVTPSGLITVWVDFNDGAGFQQVLQYQDTTPLPPTIKFGFSASTGASSAVHLIRNVEMSSVDTLPSINIEKVVDQTTPQPSAYYVGQTVPYQFIVTNTSLDPLTGVTVTDPSADTPPGIVCPSTTLTPAGTAGSTMTCTGQHTITEAEAMNPTFTNTATVMATSPTGPVPPESATAMVDIANNDAISLTKSATIGGSPAPPAVAHLDDSVDYTYDVTNTGNTPLTNVGVTDSKVPSAAITCPSTSLAPSDSTTCTATYTVTQADMDAGQVFNSATATATSPDGQIDSQPATVDIPTISSPGPLHLVKTASIPAVPSGTPVVAGDVVSYTFTVSNQGNVTLNNLQVNDSLLGVSDILCDATTLGPSGSATDTTTCRGTYQLTQADIDHGSRTNTATATAYTPSTFTPTPGPSEPITSNPDTATVTFTAHPELELQKTAAVAGTGPDGDVVAGDFITYTYIVTNTGNVTVHDLDLTDDLAGLSTPQCGTDTLAPQEQTTCTAEYEVTQQNIDSGSVVNHASVTGKDPSGGDVPPATAEVSTPLPNVASLFLEKSASIMPNGAGLDAAGATITYTYTLTNTGTVDLNDLAISDDKVPSTDIACMASSLAPGKSTTCTAMYTVTQADVNAGSHVTNTATASASSEQGEVDSNTARARVPLDRTHSLDLTKTGTAKGSGPNGIVEAGDTITYTYKVANTGTVTVKSIAVVDHLAGLSAVSCDETTLDPGDSTLCTATYKVTQADLNNGKVLNTAVAAGLSPGGHMVVSNQADHEVDLTELPELTLTKTAELTSTATTRAEYGNVKTNPRVAVIGDKVIYTYEVKNTGDVTINSIAINDPLPGLDPSSPVCTLTTLDPDQSTTCTADYILTEADFDHGGVDNVATATGQTPGGADVTSPQAHANVPLTRAPVLTLTKSGEVNKTNPAGPTMAGDTVEYTYSLLNNGNVTLTPTVVTDDEVGTVNCAGPPLAPGSTATCRATYTLTQADVDAGHVTNTATATATTMQGQPVDSNPAQLTEPIEPAPSLVLTKTAVPSGVGVGDTINYQYEVTNTGNNDLSHIAVADNKITSPSVVTCHDTSLAPGQTTTCSATYTITSGDQSAGSVTNTARASGTTPSGRQVFSAPKSTTVVIPPVISPPAAPVPAITIEKSGMLTGAGGEAKPGDAVDYSYVVTNTGNVALSNIAVNDSLGGLSAISCPVTTLAAGAATTCTATYHLSQADIDAGHVTNTATATATPATGGSVTSAPSSANVTLPRTQALTLVKTAMPSRSPAVAGATVTYHYTVTNSGTTTVKAVHVTDALPGLSAVSCNETALAPGKSTTCSATYVVSQADVDNGSLINVATAAGTGANGQKVVSPPGSATVPLDETASLSLAKSGVLSTGPVVAGHSVVKYSFTVTNTGAVTVGDIGVTDNQPALSTIDCPQGGLAPGKSVTCTATYAVTKADINHGSVADTAVATGKAPNGTGVRSHPASANVPLHQSPHLTLRKSFSYAGVGPVGTQGLAGAGSTVHYTYTVANDGNVTLSGLTVSDNRVSTGGVKCAVTTLAPGQSTTCSASYSLTQTDIDHGSVTNRATASGVAPDGTKTTSAPASATVSLRQSSQLDLRKTASPSAALPKLGGLVTWHYLVTNTGNTTVHNVSVADRAPGVSAVTCQALTLAPGASTTCTATSTVSEANVKVGWLADDATAMGLSPSGAPVVSPMAGVIIRAEEVEAPTTPPAITTTTTTVPPTTTTTAPPSTTTTAPSPATTTTVPPTTTTTKPHVPPVHVVTGYGLWGPGGPSGTQFALVGLGLLAAGGALIGLRLRRRNAPR